jgi:hypothetical protein
MLLSSFTSLLVNIPDGNICLNCRPLVEHLNWNFAITLAWANSLFRIVCAFWNHSEVANSPEQDD